MGYIPNSDSMYPARRTFPYPEGIDWKIKRAPWYPPDTIEKMRKVLLDFDDRITGSIEFMFDVDLLLKMSKNIIDKQIEDKELENEFIRLYVQVVDGYNKYVVAYNKTTSKLSRKRR